MEAVLPKPRFRRPIGLRFTFAPRPAKPCRCLATFGLLFTSWPRMSLNRASWWKIVNFLSIQGDFEPFQRQWADLSSIDRIKTSYGAIVGWFSSTNSFKDLLHCSSMNFGIIGLVETWLKDKPHDYFHLDGYSLEFNNRINDRSGGVCLYIKKQYEISHSSWFGSNRSSG